MKSSLALRSAGWALALSLVFASCAMLAFTLSLARAMVLSWGEPEEALRFRLSLVAAVLACFAHVAVLWRARTRRKFLRRACGMVAIAIPSAFLLSGHALDRAFDARHGPPGEQPGATDLSSYFVVHGEAFHWMTRPFDEPHWPFVAVLFLLCALGWFYLREPRPVGRGLPRAGVRAT